MISAGHPTGPGGRAELSGPIARPFPLAERPRDWSRCLELHRPLPTPRAFPPFCFPAPPLPPQVPSQISPLHGGGAGCKRANGLSSHDQADPACFSPLTDIANCIPALRKICKLIINNIKGGMKSGGSGPGCTLFCRILRQKYRWRRWYAYKYNYYNNIKTTEKYGTRSVRAAIRAGQEWQNACRDYSTPYFFNLRSRVSR